MKLWNSVKTTDPRHVKKITGKTYQGDSPNPYHLIERATETFGPVGIGWGVTVKSQEFMRMGEHDVLHHAVVSVWYVLDGKRSESFDQMGGTKAAYMSSAGKLIVDEDAGKKSVTDGMVKSLSMIGLAGDIFSGQWADSKYVAQALEHYEDKERAEARQLWLDATSMAIESADTKEELEKAWKATVATTKAEGDQEAYDILKPIMERMAAHIKEKTTKEAK